MKGLYLQAKLLHIKGEPSSLGGLALKAYFLFVSGDSGEPVPRRTVILPVSKAFVFAKGCSLCVGCLFI
eukprot:3785966-Amphidinium_carterae.1